MKFIFPNHWKTTPHADGRPWENTGPYEWVSGQIKIGWKPSEEPEITDLDLVPTDAGGLVWARADVRVLRPVDPARASGRLLIDIVNRGNPKVLGEFARAGHGSEADDDFLFAAGWTVAQCGWQGDLPDDPKMLRALLPEATAPDGSPLAGKIAVHHQPYTQQNTLRLAAGNQTAHPVTPGTEAEAVLEVRDHPDAPPRTIPRDQWWFGGLGPNGERQPASDRFSLQGGFQPGCTYSLTYTTTGSTVMGLGLLVIRDFIAALRGSPNTSGTNPVHHPIEATYAYGRSQSGSFLRQLLYHGMTHDRAGNRLLDGCMIVVSGGGRSELNLRMAQPAGGARWSATRLPPWADQPDPHGQGIEHQRGLLPNLPLRRPTRTFFINTAAEYWRGDAALLHLSSGKNIDLTPSESVRIYLYSGMQHGHGKPISHHTTTHENPALNPPHSLGYHALLRAALHNLDSWVQHNQTPPPNTIPTITEQTAVPPESVEAFFQSIPKIAVPTPSDRIHQLDFGSPDGIGLLNLPPTVGHPLPKFVSAIDNTGNERAGIRLPLVAVPLASHTGWNCAQWPHSPNPSQLNLAGSSLPLPRTETEKQQLHDPRPSLQSLYPSRDAFLQKINATIDSLIQQRHLLPRDRNLLLNEAQTHSLRASLPW